MAAPVASGCTPAAHERKGALFSCALAICGRHAAVVSDVVLQLRCTNISSWGAPVCFAGAHQDSQLSCALGHQTGKQVWLNGAFGGG